MSVKRMVLLAFFLAVAIGLSVAEAFLVPSFFIPGIKLGLANIIILIVLYEFGLKDAFFVTILRVFITSLCVGNIFQMGFYMSLVGALCALFSMWLIIKVAKKFTLISASVVGAVFHCGGQILVAMIFLETPYIVFYLPIIALLSILTGIFTGFIAKKILETKVFEHARIPYENKALKKVTISDDSLINND